MTEANVIKTAMLPLLNIVRLVLLKELFTGAK